MENLENIVEAVLFALGREISIDELSSTLGEEKIKIEDAIEKLKDKYSGNCGITLVKIKEMYQKSNGKSILSADDFRGYVQIQYEDDEGSTDWYNLF